MKHAFKVTGYNAETNELKIVLDSKLNIERIKTMYNDDLDNVFGGLFINDPRRFTDLQKRLYFALLGDIYKWSGHHINELHDWFKQEYIIKTYSLMSFQHTSKNTVTDANKMLEIVIEFMFEFNVPFKSGYELLTKDEEYYLYQCCKHRKCAVCGSHADIHHIDAVGSGNNRNKQDHTKKLVIALCRKHHNEAHNLGNSLFLSRNKLAGIYLDYEDFNRLGLMSRALIEELKGGN